MANQQHRIAKKVPCKDGRNARQRRADEKRAARLASEPHLAAITADHKKQRHLQCQRWVDHNMRTRQILGYQNEIRWGLKTGLTQLLSDEAQWQLERLDKERREALVAAGLDPFAGPEVAVDDWFGQTVAGGVAGVGESTGGGSGGELVDQDMEDVERRKPEEKDEPKGEVLDDSDYMSGVEMGESSH